MTTLCDGAGSDHACEPPPTQGYWTPEGDPNRYEVAIKVLNEGTATSDAQMELLQVYLMHTFNSWCVCVCM